MDIFKHPGNLGAVRGTLLTIHHADWPAYPEGDDFRIALLQLTVFPMGTRFVVVDDIDSSLLLVADVRRRVPGKPFDPKNFHIAVWYQDLVELDRRGFVDGVKCVTERAWHQHKWDELLSKCPQGATLGFKHPHGRFVPLPEPSLDDYEDDEEWSPFVVCPSGRISVTSEGRQFLLAHLRTEQMDISNDISAKVAHLFEMGFYDTCIREACVQLEHEIKSAIDSRAWGDRLTDSFMKALGNQGQFLESSIRTFRQELRTVFKFIRNDYMHNLSGADEISAYAILFRIARLRSVLAEKKNG